MFTEEQKAAIAEIVTASLKASSASEVKQPEKGQEEKSIAQQVKDEMDAAKAKSIIDQAREELQFEKSNQASLAQIQEAVKFNITIKDFVEKNKDLLPDEASKILSMIDAKTYKDDGEKANITRKNLLDCFLEKQENLSPMTSSMKLRAAAYKELAESDKQKRSAEFWDLAETGLVIKAGVKKAQALNIVNGVNADEDSKNIIGSKILALAAQRFQTTKL